MEGRQAGRAAEASPRCDRTASAAGMWQQLGGHSHASHGGVPPEPHVSGSRPSATAAGSTDSPRTSAPNSTPAPRERRARGCLWGGGLGGKAAPQVPPAPRAAAHPPHPCSRTRGVDLEVQVSLPRHGKQQLAGDAFELVGEGLMGGGREQGLLGRPASSPWRSLSALTPHPHPHPTAAATTPTHPPTTRPPTQHTPTPAHLHTQHLLLQVAVEGGQRGDVLGPTQLLHLTLAVRLAAPRGAAWGAAHGRGEFEARGGAARRTARRSGPLCPRCSPAQPSSDAHHSPDQHPPTPSTHLMGSS